MFIQWKLRGIDAFRIAGELHLEAFISKEIIKLAQISLICSANPLNCFIMSRTLLNKFKYGRPHRAVSICISFDTVSFNVYRYDLHFNEQFHGPCANTIYCYANRSDAMQTAVHLKITSPQSVNIAAQCINLCRSVHQDTGQD